jgi:hypothetical protein
MSFGAKKAKSKLGYYSTAQALAAKEGKTFDTGNHPGSKTERIMNKFLNTGEHITEAEKQTVALELEKDALAAGEKKAIEDSLCNKSLRDKVINHFEQHGQQIQALATELESKFDSIMKAPDSDKMTPTELAQLKKLISTNGGMVSPEIIEMLYKSILDKRTAPGLYERMAMNLYYYGSKVVGGTINSYGKLQEKVVAPCAGLGVDVGATTLKSVGIVTAGVFVREQILPILWTHVFPVVAEFVFARDGMTNVTGANVTMGGRKRRTHKQVKKIGKRAKTYRRRH